MLCVLHTVQLINISRLLYNERILPCLLPTKCNRSLQLLTQLLSCSIAISLANHYHRFLHDVDHHLPVSANRTRFPSGPHHPDSHFHNNFQLRQGSVSVGPFLPLMLTVLVISLAIPLGIAVLGFRELIPKHFFSVIYNYDTNTVYARAH